MDCSRNLIDLKYLINPAFTSVLGEKPPQDEVLAKDIGIYKRRIFVLTKEFLNGKKTDDVHINALFDRFASQCIAYFKFNDKKTDIQDDYKDLDIFKKIPSTNLEQGYDPNNYIMRQSQPRAPKITDHINVTSTKISKKIILPKVREHGKRVKKHKNPKNKKK